MTSGHATLLPMRDTADRSVLVIEDDEAIADAIAFHLSRAGMDVSVAHDGREGLRRLRAARPDALILDLMLPHIDGWRVIREVRSWAPELPVIVVTARTNDDDRVAVLGLGADDVVAKPFSMRELAARMDAVMRRGAPAPPDELGGHRLGDGDLVIDPERRAVTISGERVDLTPREYRLLHVLAEQRACVVPRAEIHRLVWGVERPIGDRSVDVLVRRLRRKVDETPGRYTYVQTHHGVGYRFCAMLRVLPSIALMVDRQSQPLA